MIIPEVILFLYIKSNSFSLQKEYSGVNGRMRISDINKIKIVGTHNFNLSDSSLLHLDKNILPSEEK